MQLPAGHDLPHTRARALHWLTTAAVLAAVTGAAAMIEPTGATATTAGAAPVAGPDAERAPYPLDCGPLDVLVADHASLDLDGDGRAETVAVVRCDAGSGTPPHGVYLLTHPADEGAEPRVAETLVDPSELMTVDELDTADGEISLSLHGYSSTDVPRCCPDQFREVSWAWEDGRLALHVAPAPNSV
ncbi:hypothetical protein [Streptomyces sp. SBT349]|uniref:hypothetical protein n=1 Tax=Streptomyces sp. SBT349 TaxID=1580539 RepID=UPI00066C71B8|nr:hypothetical protein [Streptomyces sp. SBT349]